MTLDLTDALCGDSPDRTDIGELGLTAVDESVTAAYDVGRTLVQGGEHVFQPGVLFSVKEDLVRTWHRLAGDQIAKGGVAAFLDRRVEAHMVAAVAHQVKDSLGLQ